MILTLISQTDKNGIIGDLVFQNPYYYVYPIVQNSIECLLQLMIFTDIKECNRDSRSPQIEFTIVPWPFY